MKIMAVSQLNLAEIASLFLFQDLRLNMNCSRILQFSAVSLALTALSLLLAPEKIFLT